MLIYRDAICVLSRTVIIELCDHYFCKMIVFYPKLEECFLDGEGFFVVGRVVCILHRESMQTPYSNNIILKIQIHTVNTQDM